MHGSTQHRTTATTDVPSADVPSADMSTSAGSTTTVGAESASADALSPRCVVDGSVLEAEIISAAGLMASARHRLVTALAAYDDTGSWALSGAHTCAQWVADRLGLHTGTAREWLRVGHALQRLPLVDAAMGEGRLSYCTVRSLTRVAVDHPGHERELVDLAERTPPRELNRTLAGWALGHDTEAERAERERRDTYLCARVEPDGMGTIHVRLPAVDMGRIQAAIDARVMQSRPANTTAPPDTPASSDTNGLPDRSGGHRSLGFQRATALVELLTTIDRNGCAATSVGTAAGVAVETEVILHVRGDGATMHDGTPIAESTVASLIDEAFIRMLIHDAENRPVNASVRRRHPTARQKRVVDERDPRCVDCGGSELLEYDHDPAWAVSHHTHTDELHRRCAGCHTRRHAASG